ncbi:MAG: DNA-3-methyladenine glycosylase family protein [Halobacteriales archaeon]
MAGRTVRADSPTPAVRALADDPHLGTLVDRHGPLRVEPAEDLFARLVRSICRQQVSMPVADAIYDRLESRVGVEPSSVLATDPEVMRGLGLSARKADTIRHVADRFANDGLSKAALSDRSNSEIRTRLTDIHGVGPWTADMQLIFTFDRSDVLPLGDLGVRRGLRSLFGDDLARDDLAEHANRWRPHRTTATLYLWAEEG